MVETKQDKKEEYKTQRDEFNKKKVELYKQITEHKKNISELEKQIENARPKTENGSTICPYCDCISRRYVGRTPQGGLSGGDDIYECEICGRSNMFDY